MATAHVITVDEYPTECGPHAVQIRSETLDWARLARGDLRPHEGRHVFVPQSRFQDRAEEYARYRKCVTVEAEAPTPRTLLAMVENLRQYAAEYRFTPEDMGDGTIAIMAASLRVPVRLAYSAHWSEEVLSELLDYFLHSPTLDVPIEPFFSLAGAIGQQNKVTLWELFDEVVGQHYFVDTQRQVSLSRRWADRDMWFGDATESTHGFETSELWNTLEELRQRVFSMQTPCAFCEHYPYCEAFWMTAEHADESCRVWRGLMDRMVAAFRDQTAGGGAVQCQTS